MELELNRPIQFVDSMIKDRERILADPKIRKGLIDLFGPAIIAILETEPEMLREFQVPKIKSEGDELSEFFKGYSSAIVSALDQQDSKSLEFIIKDERKERTMVKSKKRTYEERVEKALSRLGKLKTPETKDLSDSAIGVAVRRAATAGVREILSGLSEDLTNIIAAEGSDTQAQVNEVFKFANAAVRRILGMAEIKSGKANWINYALTGAQEPRDPEPEKTWISDLGGS